MNKMNLLQTLIFITNHPLNRNKKLMAVLRYLCWQIRSRLASGPIEVNFVNKTKLLVATGMTGATGNIYCGLHEFEDMTFVLHALRPEDTFVDVGANIGSYTILAAGAVGAKNFSFEPIPTTYNWLIKNIELNNLKHLVNAQNIGIGAVEGELFFSDCLDTVNHVVEDSEIETTSIKVPVKALDTFLPDIKGPIFMKVDVEGFESKVIEGADRLLSRPDCLSVIMELNGSGQRYGFDEETIHKRMLGYGFESFTYEPFTRELKPLMGRNNHAGNTLYIKNSDIVSERVKTANKFFVNSQSL